MWVSTVAKPVASSHVFGAPDVWSRSLPVPSDATATPFPHPSVNGGAALASGSRAATSRVRHTTGMSTRQRRLVRANPARIVGLPRRPFPHRRTRRCDDSPKSGDFLSPVQKTVLSRYRFFFAALAGSDLAYDVPTLTHFSS